MKTENNSGRGEYDQEERRDTEAEMRIYMAETIEAEIRSYMAERPRNHNGDGGLLIKILLWLHYW